MIALDLAIFGGLGGGLGGGGADDPPDPTPTHPGYWPEDTESI